MTRPAEKNYRITLAASGDSEAVTRFFGMALDCQPCLFSSSAHRA